MNNMLSKALREFTTGPLNQLIVNLGGQDGSQWEEELKKFLRKEPCWSSGQVAQAPFAQPHHFLKFVSTVVIPATLGQFVAKDRFVVNTEPNAPVKINDIDNSFRSCFIDKVEEPIVETELRCMKIRKSSMDRLIISELGGKKKSETTLTEMFPFMKRYKSGEHGIFLNTGCGMIFYIRDKVGVLRLVYAYPHWCDESWSICATEINSYRCKWKIDQYVFSRNFILEPSEPVPVAN